MATVRLSAPTTPQYCSPPRCYVYEITYGWNKRSCYQLPPSQILALFLFVWLAYTWWPSFSLLTMITTGQTVIKYNYSYADYLFYW